MPPKSKKEQEEQARRLQEQQRRREEEEARLALERKKYQHQTIATGLQLPASNQLLLELPLQTTEFISQKLRDNALAIIPEIANDQSLLDLLTKELLNYSVDSFSLFNLSAIKQAQGNEQLLLKARVFVGIAFKILCHQHTSLGGSGKSKQADEQLLKEELMVYVGRGEGRLKLYNIKEVQAILKFLKDTYFNHYLLLWNYSSFQKRHDQQQTRIFINVPSTFRNHKDTPSTDLAIKTEKADH